MAKLNALFSNCNAELQILHASHEPNSSKGSLCCNRRHAIDRKLPSAHQKAGEHHATELQRPRPDHDAVLLKNHTPAGTDSA